MCHRGHGDYITTNGELGVRTKRNYNIYLLGNYNIYTSLECLFHDLSGFIAKNHL